MAVRDSTVVKSAFRVWERDPSATGAKIETYHDSASPAGSDVISRIRVYGRDSGGAKQEYARIETSITDPTAASEDATLDFYTIQDGTLTKVLSLGPNITFDVPAPAGATTELVGINIAETVAQTFLTGANLTYSGGRGSSMIKLDNTFTPTTGGFHNIYSKVTNTGIIGTDGHGVAGIKSYVDNTAAITDGEMYAGLFISKKSGSGITLAAATHIGLEGWFYETGDSVIRTGIGGNFGYHIDSSAADHGAGSVHRGIQIFCDDAGTSQAVESTALCLWNMTGTQHNAINVVTSGSGFTNFALFSTSNGAPASSTGTIGGSQAGYIKVKIAGTTHYIQLYPTLS